VIFNGKIVTPQSLLPRKQNASQGNKKYKTGASTKPREDTISELPEKTGSTYTSKLSSKAKIPSTLASESNVLQERISRKLNQMIGDTSKTEEKVSVHLSETSTEILFFLPSLIISNETRELVAVEERNSKYEQIIEAHKNSDGFSSRPTQTLNNSQKNQNDMSAPNASQDFGCQAVSYDITDALSGSRAAVDPEGNAAPTADSFSDERSSGLTPYVRKVVRDTVGVSIATPGCLLNVDDLTRPTGPAESNPKEGTRVGGGNAGGRSMRASNLVSGGGASHSNAGTGSGNNHGHNPLGGDGSGSKPSNSGVNIVGSNVNQLGGGASSNVGPGDMSEDEAQDRPQQSETGDGSSSDQGGPGAVVAPDGRQLLREREAAAVMTSKALLRKLQLAERTVLQNIYHRQHLDYRDLPDVQPLVLASRENAQVVDSTDQLFGSLGIGGITMAMGVTMGKTPTSKGKSGGSSNNNKAKTMRSSGTNTTEAADPAENEDTPSGPAPGSGLPGSTLPRLFCYRAESVVRGRPVTALAWNSANADLLAVGYGRVDFALDGGQRPGKGVAVDEELQGGLVLFWSLRNPEHPEKVLRTPHPVTALDFSRRDPTLLALGLYSGDVSVYDVRREADWGKPVQSSLGMEGGHADPVWYVLRPHHQHACLNFACPFLMSMAAKRERTPCPNHVSVSPLPSSYIVL